MFVVGGVLLIQACLLTCWAVDRELTLTSRTHLRLSYLFIYLLLLFIYFGGANAGSISASEVGECLHLIKDAYISYLCGCAFWLFRKPFSMI